MKQKLLWGQKQDKLLICKECSTLYSELENTAIQNFINTLCDYDYEGNPCNIREVSYYRHISICPNCGFEKYGKAYRVGEE